MIARMISAGTTCLVVALLGQACMPATALAGDCLATPGNTFKPRELKSLILKRKSYNPHLVPPLRGTYKICVAGEKALQDARERHPAHYKNAIESIMKANPRYKPRVLAPEPDWRKIGYSTEEHYFDGQHYAHVTHGESYAISEDGYCALLATPVERATIETGKEIIEINITRGEVKRKPHLVSKDETKRRMAGVPLRAAMMLASGFEAGQAFWDNYWPPKGEIKAYGACCRFTIPEKEASGKSRMCVLEVAPFFHGYRDYVISLRDEPLGVDGGAWTEATDVMLDARVNQAVFTPDYYLKTLRTPPVAGGSP